MNKAISHLIDREAAASLIEPLTDLVIRAGAAILAVNRAAMKVDGKTDGSPGPLERKTPSGFKAKTSSAVVAAGTTVTEKPFCRRRRANLRSSDASHIARTPLGVNAERSAATPRSL